MSKEMPNSICDLPKSNKWSGDTKYYTNECLVCDGYAEFSDGEVCFYGKAWKLLTKEKVLKTCSFKKKVDKERKVALTPKPPTIVYTPSFSDFYDGTLELLTSLGFKQVLVRREDIQDTPPGFSIK